MTFSESVMFLLAVTVRTDHDAICTAYITEILL